MGDRTRAELLELICKGFSKLDDFQKGYFLGVGDGLTAASAVQRDTPSVPAAAQQSPGA